VWPGDTLTAVVTVSAHEGDEALLEITTTNQDGSVVLSGTAACRMDS
jgi:acyl dehydratase